MDTGRREPYLRECGRYTTSERKFPGPFSDADQELGSVFGLGINDGQDTTVIMRSKYMGGSYC